MALSTSKRKQLNLSPISTGGTFTNSASMSTKTLSPLVQNTVPLDDSHLKKHQHFERGSGVDTSSVLKSVLSGYKDKLRATHTEEEIRRKRDPETWVSKQTPVVLRPLEHGRSRVVVGGQSLISIPTASIRKSQQHPKEGSSPVKEKTSTESCKKKRRQSGSNSPQSSLSTGKAKKKQNTTTLPPSKPSRAGVKSSASPLLYAQVDTPPASAPLVPVSAQEFAQQWLKLDENQTKHKEEQRQKKKKTVESDLPPILRPMLAQKKALQQTSEALKPRYTLRAEEIHIVKQAEPTTSMLPALTSVIKKNNKKKNKSTSLSDDETTLHNEDNGGGTLLSPMQLPVVVSLSSDSTGESAKLRESSVYKRYKAAQEEAEANHENSVTPERMRAQPGGVGEAPQTLKEIVHQARLQEDKLFFERMERKKRLKEEKELLRVAEARHLMEVQIEAVAKIEEWYGPYYVKQKRLLYKQLDAAGAEAEAIDLEEEMAVAIIQSWALCIALPRLRRRRARRVLENAARQQEVELSVQVIQRWYAQVLKPRLAARSSERLRAQLAIDQERLKAATTIQSLWRRSNPPTSTNLKASMKSSVAAEEEAVEEAIRQEHDFCARRLGHNFFATFDPLGRKMSAKHAVGKMAEENTHRVDVLKEQAVEQEKFVAAKMMHRLVQLKRKAKEVRERTQKKLASARQSVEAERKLSRRGVAIEEAIARWSGLLEPLLRAQTEQQEASIFAFGAWACRHELLPLEMKLVHRNLFAEEAKERQNILHTMSTKPTQSVDDGEEPPHRRQQQQVVQSSSAESSDDYGSAGSGEVVEYDLGDFDPREGGELYEQPAASEDESPAPPEDDASAGNPPQQQQQRWNCNYNGRTDEEQAALEVKMESNLQSHYARRFVSNLVENIVLTHSYTAVDREEEMLHLLREAEDLVEHRGVYLVDSEEHRVEECVERVAQIRHSSSSLDA